MKIRTVFALACAALLMASCAKKESENSSVVERDILAKWIATHVTGEPTLTGHADGLYTIVKHSTSSLDALSPVEGDWVEVIYTGYAIPVPPMALYPQDGNVFVTRDADIAAQQLASNPYRTHYAAQKLYMSEANMTAAMFRTLQMMKKGETWRFFAPSGITYGSYGSSYGYGYQGQSALVGGVPSYMDLELVNVIKDLAKYEQNAVWNYAKDNLGKTDVADSLKYYSYLKQEYLGDAPAGNTRQDTITADSTVKVYYVGRFLDGFVFDTNIDSVAQRVWGSSSGGLKPISYTPSTMAPGTTNGLIQAFYDAVTVTRYNSWGHMVFTSDYGYGYSGQTPSTTNYASEIDPYTPLVFDFYLAPYDGDRTGLEEEQFAYVDFGSDPFSAAEPWSYQQVSGTQYWIYRPYNYSGYFTISGMGTTNDCWLISPPYDLSAATLPRMYLTHRLIKSATGKNSDISMYYSNTATGAFNAADWTPIPLTSYPSEWSGIGPILLDQYSPGETFRVAFRLNSTAATDSRWDIMGVEFFQMVEDDE